MTCREMDERRKGGIQSRGTTKKEEPEKEELEKPEKPEKEEPEKEEPLGGLSAKRKRNGIIYLTRNNDGLSR